MKERKKKFRSPEMQTQGTAKDEEKRDTPGDDQSNSGVTPERGGVFFRKRPYLLGKSIVLGVEMVNHLGLNQNKKRV